MLNTQYTKSPQMQQCQEERGVEEHPPPLKQEEGSALGVRQSILVPDRRGRRMEATTQVKPSPEPQGSCSPPHLR